MQMNDSKTYTEMQIHSDSDTMLDKISTARTPRSWGDHFQMRRDIAHSSLGRKCGLTKQARVNFEQSRIASVLQTRAPLGGGA